MSVAVRRLTESLELHHEFKLANRQGLQSGFQFQIVVISGMLELFSILNKMLKLRFFWRQKSAFWKPLTSPHMPPTPSPHCRQQLTPFLAHAGEEPRIKCATEPDSLLSPSQALEASVLCKSLCQLKRAQVLGWGGSGLRRAHNMHKRKHACPPNCHACFSQDHQIPFYSNFM